MKTLNLRFVTEAGLVSWAIRWFGTGPWSHVGWMVSWISEIGARSGIDYAPSGKPGVQSRPADYARFTSQATVAILVTDEEFAAFDRLISLEIGKPYSHRTILGFVLGRNVPEHQSRPAWDCSTLMAWGLLHAGIMAPGLVDDLRQISPSALYRIARQIEYDRQKVTP